MSVDVAGFRARFPEFADTTLYSDERVDLFLEDAALQINRGAWGAKADLGTYYLAAHSLAVDSTTGITGGTFGPVVSESVGQVSRSYGSGGSSSAAGEWGSTKYGVLYYRLWRTIIATPIVL